MSKEELDELKAKKEELEAELNRIQHELDSNIDEVRADVSEKLKPSEIIKNYPIPVVGLSVFVGFLAGHTPKRKGSSRPGSHSSGDGFAALLISELKKIATRKAVSAATDYFDNFIESRKGDLLNHMEETPEQES
ncbi:hypothetical protein [Halalkalibaculum sp. DA384]|uniref:hypothetical protein n=1 Tax=Halalkalibaculum sp. DA384 TaxID=3373606 RepID=UPI0037550854